MALQIAIDYNEVSERELVKMGFVKREVYVKSVEGSYPNSDKEIKAGDKEFMNMKNPPNQFVTVSYWGKTAD